VLDWACGTQIAIVDSCTCACTCAACTAQQQAAKPAHQRALFIGSSRNNSGWPAAHQARHLAADQVPLPFSTASSTAERAYCTMGIVAALSLTSRVQVQHGTATSPCGVAVLDLLTYIPFPAATGCRRSVIG
jgi:hypothetical protein